MQDKGTSPWIVLAGFLGASYLAAFVGNLATDSAIRNWYPTLLKPAWTPPSWVFGPVWTVLYTAMAVAAWWVWRRAGWCGALGWWTTQLMLNALWSPVFFGLRRPDLAFGVICALWLAIAATTVMFWRTSLLAGALFVPYWAWVSFAAALNFAIWKLNDI